MSNIDLDERWIASSVQRRVFSVAQFKRQHRVATRRPHRFTNKASADAQAARARSLCLGRINTPASVIGIGHMEWAGSAARIERYVELSILAVFADNFSRTIRLKRLQIDSE